MNIWQTTSFKNVNWQFTSFNNETTSKSEKTKYTQTRSKHATKSLYQQRAQQMMRSQINGAIYTHIRASINLRDT